MSGRRLSDEQERQFVQRKKAGESASRLAAEFGVSRDTVYSIARRLGCPFGGAGKPGPNPGMRAGDIAADDVLAGRGHWVVRRGVNVWEPA